MMKIIIPSISIIFMSHMPSITTSLISILLIILTLSINQPLLIMNSMFMMDKLTIIMLILTTISVILIMISSQNLSYTIPTIIPIFIILMITFSSSNMILFYIFFELVLIPTLILISKSGKQPERLQAGVYLIMYTIFGSLPLLIGILLSKNNPNMIYSYMINTKFNFPIIFMMAFLIKLPMFFTHLWLPKAHVEAPLEGSMILAAILLKLGGYGLIRFIPFILHKLHSSSYWFVSISMMGATFTGLNCMRQKDLKSLIAYSSVAHMGLVLASIMTLNTIGQQGAIIMMIGHGLSSSALFFLVNILYTNYHTRNILTFKGIISIFPNITFWWFLFLAINMSAPPTINTISEILIMSSLINWSPITMLSIFTVSIATASFSIILYANLSHNHPEMTPSNQMTQKNFLSLWTHLTPIILMTLMMEIMFY